MGLWDVMAETTNTDSGFCRSGVLFVTRDPAKIAREYELDSRILPAEQAAALTPGSSVRHRQGSHLARDCAADQ